MHVNESWQDRGEHDFLGTSLDLHGLLQVPHPPTHAHTHTYAHTHIHNTHTYQNTMTATVYTYKQQLMRNYPLEEGKHEVLGTGMALDGSPAGSTHTPSPRPTQHNNCGSTYIQTTTDEELPLGGRWTWCPWHRPGSRWSPAGSTAPWLRPAGSQCQSPWSPSLGTHWKTCSSSPSGKREETELTLSE